MAFMNFVHDKIKTLPLPDDFDLSPIFNMVHGQLEAMGFPGNGSISSSWISIDFVINIAILK